MPLAHNSPPEEEPLRDYMRIQPYKLGPHPTQRHLEYALETKHTVARKQQNPNYTTRLL